MPSNSGPAQRATSLLRPLASVAIAGGIAAAGYRAHALSRDGALAATGVGTAFLRRRDPRALAAMAMFFVSGSALSRLHERSDIAARGSQRDAWQVVANGGVAALAALGSRESHDRAAAALLGALAAATADTWATEIGQLSTTPPRLLLARTPAPAGTSGAVSALGLLGSLAGSSVIAALAFAPTRSRRATAVGAAGVAGALADTLLGELVQERRWCPTCEQHTEATVHRCGTASTHVGGVAGLNNDVVNLLCTAVGAGVAAVFAGDGR